MYDLPVGGAPDLNGFYFETNRKENYYGSTYNL